MQNIKKNLLLLCLLLVLAFAPVGSASENNTNEILFILGTDFNEVALNNAALNSTIAAELNITVYIKNATVPHGVNFSDYHTIFIESVNESQTNEWADNITTAQSNGSIIIGYNLSPNASLPTIDLRSAEYDNIERYWIQGGTPNMENLLMFMGQKFADKWNGTDTQVPQIVSPKTNITLILNHDSDIYTLNKLISEDQLIKERFNVNAMTAFEVLELEDYNWMDQDVIILYVVSGSQLEEMKDSLISAQDNGAKVGLIGMSLCNPFIANDIEDTETVKEYIVNAGTDNMENLIRYTANILDGTYIEYDLPQSPSIPTNGIYHPDVFPYIFENGTEYLEWYMDHGYDASAPTIGVIRQGSMASDSIDYRCEDAIIRNLESKGCNVICTTPQVFSEDVDYFIINGEVLVDTIISMKMFRLNYYYPDVGVEYLEMYNVPVIKAIQDYYISPSEFNNSSFGMDSTGVPSQVCQPELDSCIEFIWMGGRTQDSDTERYYYAPHMSQVDWLCNRAIGWAELGRTSNQDKKVSVIYYNHEGGKNNIGASYLDITPSFTLLLEQMNESGYDLGNNSIPNGSEFVDLFIESRNVGSWAPGELEKVVNSGKVAMVPVNQYLEWYNTLPEEIRLEVEDAWGEAPGDIMVYEGDFVIPKVQVGNIIFVPQPTRAGLSDESKVFHNKTMPPTHQYLATYYWINNVYDTDAMIHFGTHGTQEWLPGNEVGLWQYDYPSIMVNDTPVIYPYIVDDVAEGTQAKRRGNAVIIDHLTPPIISSGLYGELVTLHDKIHSYNGADDPALKALYRNSTIELYDSLGLEDELTVTSQKMSNMTEQEFGQFVDNDLHDYLHELKSTLIPYGLHVFGEAPENVELVLMVKSIIGSDFIDHIMAMIPHDTGDEEDWNEAADAYATELLNATLLNSTNVSVAQTDILNFTDPDITADLNTALYYSDQLGQTTREIDQTLRALNAEYIEAGPGNDPIRNPDALPTGKNFYSFDQRTIPDEETEALGAILADQLVEQHRGSNNNTYPNKVAFVLWSVETMRNNGVMEAEIYSLLGVKPVRDKYGRFVDFEIIPLENMSHPRIDVVITASGLYRDTFSYQIEMMDSAIRAVSELNETNETNYVRYNSLRIYDELLLAGYNNSTAYNISESRIFSEAPGDYGTGLTLAIPASDTWDNESKLADLYISKVSSIYGANMWGQESEDAFRLNLQDVDAAVHSDSSNLYGTLDNDDFYQYMGGLGLAVRSLTGETPEMYVANLEDANSPQMITLEEAFRTEMRARYLNPTWIEGMMEHGYGGAREFQRLTEFLWAWDVVTPGMVEDSDWERIYDVYINDKYDIGVDEFLQNDNPYMYQSIAARMLETIRKDYWDASDETVQSLTREYMESVVENGVTCCHHTCGNPLLDEFVQGIASVPGVVSESVAADYAEIMLAATTLNVEDVSTETTETVHKSGGNPTGGAKVTEPKEGNQTIDNSGGVGMNLEDEATLKSTTETNYVEGYEMVKESSEESSSQMFSGADMLGIIAVLVILGIIAVGWRRKF